MTFIRFAIIVNLCILISTALVVSNDFSVTSSLSKPVVTVFYDGYSGDKPEGIDRDFTVISCMDNEVVSTTDLHPSGNVLIGVVSSEGNKVNCNNGKFFINNVVATDKDIISLYLENIFYI